MRDEKVYADAADLEFQIDMLEGFDANSDDKYNTQMICWLKELQQRRAIQSCNSAQPVTVPDDTRRMDWLVSKTVNVREPMVYGSHDLFWSQTISDDWEEEHKTTLREQIDAAMAAAPKVTP